MRVFRFSVEQLVAVLKETEIGTPVVHLIRKSVAHLIRKVRISEQTFCLRKKVYGGLQPSQASKLDQLEQENADLKRLVPDLSIFCNNGSEFVGRSLDLWAYLNRQD